MADPRLGRLSLIADLVRDRDTALLVALEHKVAALLAEAAALASGDDATAPTPFNRAGRAAARDAWAQRERIRINAELARLRAEKTTLHDRVARAIARARVIERLGDAPR